jgi:hypothetical protein
MSPFLSCRILTPSTSRTRISLVLEIPSYQKELYMAIMFSTYYEDLISVVGAFTAMSTSQLVGSLYGEENKSV